MRVETEGTVSIRKKINKIEHGNAIAIYFNKMFKCNNYVFFYIGSIISILQVVLILFLPINILVKLNNIQWAEFPIIQVKIMFYTIYTQIEIIFCIANILMCSMKPWKLLAY